MEKMAHQPEPAAYPAILEAFEVSRQLEVWKRAPMSVGVCRADGKLVARGVLEDWRQVRLFSIHMEAMGYGQLILGEEDTMHGCDVVYRPETLVATA